MAPKPVQVDLDLDVLAPDTRTFRFRDEVYALPGDIPVPTLVLATKLRDQMERAGADDATEDEQTEAVERLYALVMEIIRDENPGLPDLRVTVTQLLYLLGLILSGKEEDVADVIRREITGGADGDAEPAVAEDESHPPTPRKRKPKAA